MDLNKRAELLTSRLNAFDAVLELEAYNFRILDRIARGTFESDNPIDLVDRRKSWIMDLAYKEIRYAIFNYVSSAVALLNQARRGSKKESPKCIYELFSLKSKSDHLFDYVTNHFDEDDIHGLVLEIRNICTHHRLPMHVLSIDVMASKGRMTIPKKYILEVGETRGPVRKFVESFEDDIELLPLIRKHHDSLHKFHRWVHSELAPLWKEEHAILKTKRYEKIELGLWQLKTELEEALSLTGDAVFERLHFTLSGVLRAEEQVKLLPFESDKRDWVTRAYEVVRSRIPIPDEIHIKLRSIITG